MPRMHDPIEVAKELLFDLCDKSDPALNYIEALRRLITHAEGDSQSPLKPFPDKYEEQRNADHP